MYSLPAVNKSLSERYIRSYSYGFNGQEKDNQIRNINGADYGAEFWEYDALTGRRRNRDPIEKPGESPYAAFGNSPITNADPNGKDSVQRAKAVSEAKDYIKKNKGYLWGGMGGPGTAVDCEGLVANCIQSGGEKWPNTHPKHATWKDDGVNNIIHQPTTKEIDIKNAEIGNIITFTGSPEHIGIISDVIKDDNGNTVGFEVIGSQSSTGAAKIYIRLDKSGSYDKLDKNDKTANPRKWAGYWSPKVNKAYKWDTKADPPKFNGSLTGYLSDMLKYVQSLKPETKDKTKK
jgi:RHS repeat-associated protein